MCRITANNKKKDIIARFSETWEKTLNVEKQCLFIFETRNLIQS